MELDIIIYLSDRDKYNNYYKYIKEHTLTKEAATILQDVGEWFADDSSRSVVDFAAFATWFKLIKHPVYKADKQEIFQRIFDRLETHTVDPTLEEQLIEHFIGLDYFTKIADVANRGAEGAPGASIEDVEALLDAYHSVCKKASDIDSHLVTDDFSELIETTSAGGLSWRLKDLNLAAGPIRQGNLIIVGKRPDTGGTSFWASEATHMAQQLPEDRNVVCILNEEPGTTVKKRVVCSALAKTNQDFDDNPIDIHADYVKLLGRVDKIRCLHNNAMTIQDCEKHFKAHNPGLIILDQAWKLHGFEKESNGEVDRQSMIFNRAREWASQYAPVIIIHQADGLAEGQKYPDMSRLYGSKTAIQGEADLIIMIGRSHEPGYEDSRFIHLPKNKLPGGPLSDPAYRNLKVEVRIRADIGRFESNL